jgi:sec-independent protein translocase protein TatB
MFTIVFFELFLISIIGLIILGPERLPIVVRTFRNWFIGIKHFNNSMKTELAEELDIKDLSADLKNQKNNT